MKRKVLVWAFGIYPVGDFDSFDGREFLDNFLGGQLLRRLTCPRLIYASWRHLWFPYKPSHFGQLHAEI